jgi:hypothetical protein
MLWSFLKPQALQAECRSSSPEPQASLTALLLSPSLCALIFVGPAQPSVAGSLHLGLGENTPRASLDTSGRRLQGSVTRTSFAPFPVARLTVCLPLCFPLTLAFVKAGGDRVGTSGPTMTRLSQSMGAPHAQSPNLGSSSLRGGAATPGVYTPALALAGSRQVVQVCTKCTATHHS